MTTPVDPVGLVELKIERRRAQLLHEWEGARDYVESKNRQYVAQKNRWAPLVAVAGAVALGYGLSRPRGTPAAIPAGRDTGTQRGILAGLLATLNSGLKFAMSPAGRTLWTSFSGARAGRWAAR